MSANICAIHASPSRVGALQQPSISEPRSKPITFGWVFIVRASSRTNNSSASPHIFKICCFIGSGARDSLSILKEVKKQAFETLAEAQGGGGKGGIK